MNELIELINNEVNVSIFSLDLPNHDILHQEISRNDLLSRTFYFRFRNILKLRSKFGFLMKLLAQNKSGSSQRIKLAYFAQLAQEMKCDRLHSHFVHKQADVISRLSDLPLSITAHCYEEQAMSEDAKRRLEKIIERCAFVVTATDFAKAGLSKLAPRDTKKIKTIRCGISLRKFSSQDIRRSTTFNIVSVAGLYPRKGTRYLIEALGLIKNKADYKLYLVGDGPERPNLEEVVDAWGISGFVEFIGHADSEAVLNYLKIADCFVLPCIVTGDGLMDGLPVALMEAMAMRIPTISTPVAGVPELIIHDQNGLVVPQADPRALSRAIMRLYDNRELCELLGRNAREKIEKEYDVKITAKQLAREFCNA
ncbi:MAG: glycosyltransferase family 4 protein [Candidatus Eisenbacteria bacterium]|uniref:Glycosyltransferase family 4 protein n=1 Tax=Eiseniibacteriota bacterium TaxID=2212470 RepID=A0A948S0Q2_UNCEI|nr:glycosyltransferase family 4 protein [Candidatus Eisenbacteria bacterium]